MGAWELSQMFTEKVGFDLGFEVRKQLSGTYKRVLCKGMAEKSSERK